MYPSSTFYLNPGDFYVGHKGFGRCRTRGDFEELVTNYVVLSLFCPELTGLKFAFEPSSKYTSKVVQNIPVHNVLLMSNVRSDS